VKFGPIPVAEAENAIVAHGLRLDEVTLKKGQVVTPERRRALSAASGGERTHPMRMARRVTLFCDRSSAAQRVPMRASRPS